jgi:hypothetical protein
VDDHFLKRYLCCFGVLPNLKNTFDEVIKMDFQRSDPPVDNVMLRPAEEGADLNLERLFIFVFDANVFKVLRIDAKRNDVSNFSRQRVDDRQDVRLAVLNFDEGDRADVVVVDALSFVEQGGTRRLVFAQRILKSKKSLFKLSLM